MEGSSENRMRSVTEVLKQRLIYLILLYSVFNWGAQDKQLWLQKNWEHHAEKVCSSVDCDSFNDVNFLLDKDLFFSEEDFGLATGGGA